MLLLMFRWLPVPLLLLRILTSNWSYQLGWRKTKLINFWFSWTWLADMKKGKYDSWTYVLRDHSLQGQEKKAEQRRPFRVLHAHFLSCELSHRKKILGLREFSKWVMETISVPGFGVCCFLLCTHGTWDLHGLEVYVVKAPMWQMSVDYSCGSPEGPWGLASLWSSL